MVKRKIKISNNILSALLIFAIFSMVLGVWVNFDRLSPLTGEATGNATVTLVLDSAVSCTTTAGDGDNSIVFGNLTRGSSETSDGEADYHIIENDGNVELTIEAYTFEDLWTNALYLAPHQYWQIACNSTQSGTCNTSWRHVDIEAQKSEIINSLNGNATLDIVTVEVNVTGPSTDEPTGEKSGSITYYCTAT